MRRISQFLNQRPKSSPSPSPSPSSSSSSSSASFFAKMVKGTNSILPSQQGTNSGSASSLPSHYSASSHGTSGIASANEPKQYNDDNPSDLSYLISLPSQQGTNSGSASSHGTSGISLDLDDEISVTSDLTNSGEANFGFVEETIKL